MRKKILIVSYSYPPSNAPAAQRPYALAKYLDKEKYEISVLTCLNQDSSLGFDTSFNPHLDNVNLIKIRSLSTSSARNVKQSSMKGGKQSFSQKVKLHIIRIVNKFIFPDNAVFWLFYVIPFVLKNRKLFQSDIVFSTSPIATNHLVARFILLLNRKSLFVVDFRDFHYLENFQLKKGIIPKFHGKFEYNTIKRADKVVFISDLMKNAYSECYHKFSEKFVVVYNGYDKNEYADIEMVNGSNLSIFYAGTFYSGVRSPKPLLFALEELINNNEINIENIDIEIAGNIEQSLVEEINELKIFQRIKFLGLLPRQEILQKHCNSHLLWLIVSDKPSHYLGVPIKMFEYMASKRFILNFSPAYAETNRIISETGTGFNFENSDNSQHNVNEFRKIIELYKSGELNKKVDSKLTELYLKKNQITKLTAVFEK